jgi:hypothetical protein
MLFRKKIAAPRSPAPTAPDVAWDDKTTAHFAKADRFDVQITRVGKRFGFGQTRPGEPMREPDGYEVYGVITFPKLVLVTLSFEGRDSEFGGWFYHLYDSSTSKSDQRSVPFLDMWITDSDGGIRKALYESHKAALLCGQRRSLARFWKRAGDGVMTEKDREHGYSFESRYPLIGLYTWAELESKLLPSWAIPYGTDGFSLNNLPPWSLVSQRSWVD